MKAAIATGIRKIHCEDVPTPKPKQGMLIVDVELAAVCGSDLHVVYSEYWPSEGSPLVPGWPGHEGLGRVSDAGGSDFSVGELVLMLPAVASAGTFAEYTIIDPNQVLRLPDTKPHSELLMAQQLGTVIFACKRLPPLKGKTVVVIGQGTAGLFHDFVICGLGAERIIAIEPMPARRALSKRMGADTTIDVTGAPATEAVYDLTDGKGADVVVDAVGSVETLNQALDIAGKDGRIAAFGLPTSRARVQFHWSTFLEKSQTMHAVHGGQLVPGLPDFRAAIDLIVNDKIDVSPLPTHTLPITRIKEAFDLAESRKNNAVKVLVSCNN
ncbi:MAG: zinc-binding dehydrogenase [SAR202 cluster bacterium]|jgi:L-iditol 2-dehydrogenase|nr:zinc-binding dehydrogenase [SAR202 cluster bacterium]